MNALALQRRLTHDLERGAPEALETARELLRQRPDDPIAHYLYGIAAHQRGQHREAAQHLRQALQLAPDAPEIHNALGAVLVDAGDAEAALDILQRAVALAPNEPQPQANLAAALIALGRRQDALAHYQRLLEHHPHHRLALDQAVRLALELGASDVLRHHFPTLARLAPEAAAQLAPTLMDHFIQRGEDDTAAELLDTLWPHIDFQHRLHLANHWLTHHRKARAEAAYRRLLQAHPEAPEAHNNLASVLALQGRLDEALAAIEHGLSRHPERHDLHANHAAILLDLDRPEDARNAAEAALRLAPDDPTALINLGAAQHRLGEHAAARATLERVLALVPDHPQAWYNLGGVHHDLGELEQAQRCYREALARQPDHHDARANLGLLLLTRGQLAEGWQHYFYRARHIAPREPLTPIQPGRDHRGLRLLLTHAQGLGDELFFLRFAPALKAQGAWIAYRSSTKLAPLLRHLPWLDALLEEHQDAPPDLDAVYAVDDLPLLLDAGDDDHPPPVPLRPDPARVEAWRQRLARLGPPPYLGLTWRAGSRDDDYRQHRFLHKEMPLDVLAESIAGLPGTLLSLQRHPQDGEIEHLARLAQRPVHDLAAANDDLQDALALLACLDHYLGVSNTNMHLRAGLGQTAHVFVPHPPEWRWRETGDESPWFPGFAVHRQRPDGRWDEAIAHCRRRLAAP